MIDSYPIVYLSYLLTDKRTLVVPAKDGSAVGVLVTTVIKGEDAVTVEPAADVNEGSDPINDVEVVTTLVIQKLVTDGLLLLTILNEHG